MKRDCGDGELVPYCYKIIYSPGTSDREVKIPATGIDDPRFEDILSRLEAYGNVRLYVMDKQGYMNCIRHVFITENGEICIAKDRRNELR